VAPLLRAEVRDDEGRPLERLLAPISSASISIGAFSLSSFLVPADSEANLAVIVELAPERLFFKSVIWLTWPSGILEKGYCY
jgi:hypothetical protein